MQLLRLEEQNGFLMAKSKSSIAVMEGTVELANNSGKKSIEKDQLA